MSQLLSSYIKQKSIRKSRLNSAFNPEWTNEENIINAKSKNSGNSFQSNVFIEKNKKLNVEIEKNTKEKKMANSEVLEQEMSFIDKHNNRTLGLKNIEPIDNQSNENTKIAFRRKENKIDNFLVKRKMSASIANKTKNWKDSQKIPSNLDIIELERDREDVINLENLEKKQLTFKFDGYSNEVVLFSKIISNNRQIYRLSNQVFRH